MKQNQHLTGTHETLDSPSTFVLSSLVADEIPPVRQTSTVRDDYNLPSAATPMDTISGPPTSMMNPSRSSSSSSPSPQPTSCNFNGDRVKTGTTPRHLSKRLASLVRGGLDGQESHIAVTSTIDNFGSSLSVSRRFHHRHQNYHNHHSMLAKHEGYQHRLHSLTSLAPPPLCQVTTTTTSSFGQDPIAGTPTSVAMVTTMATTIPEDHDATAFTPQPLPTPAGGSAVVASTGVARTEFELCPGFFVPLRGLHETLEYLGRCDPTLITSTFCHTCNHNVHFLADAALGLCPTCRLILPLEGKDNHNQAGCGVSLGFLAADRDELQAVANSLLIQ